ILGGMKSGKSSYASSLAQQHGGQVAYLATAQPGDGEMAHRIRRHQEERPQDWLTVEEAINPASCFDQWTNGIQPKYLDVPSHSAVEPQVVLLDCLTLWLTNLLSPLGDEPNRVEALEKGNVAVTKLISSILNWEQGEPKRQTLIVSNEVESGLVSPWPLGRIFQDLSGLSHQKMAQAATEVYVMHAGLPLKLK
ncbi:MAG: bifunctional adenosylcobinamide kinase/adenosylcobinamide-phosphate guanylyltransferase, partial [Spirochaetales bacterium]|nr:bifunctional adenosylcobinamide kinase/adenosylcobinamide-phosphate guanylyltransferase [Spirochaetales bacterium]